MPEREPLPPGQLPNIFDTDPPPMHPATEVGDGYVRIDTSKCSKDELAEVHARQPVPNIYTPPEPERHAAHGRHPQQEPTGRH